MQGPINNNSTEEPKTGNETGMKRMLSSFSTQGDYGRIGPSTHNMEIMAERRKDLDHYTAWNG